MDAIVISDFVVLMHIGLTDEERATLQRIRIDVKIVTDFTEVISTGTLECGMNYARVRKDIREIANSQPFVLLEVFGSEIMRKLMQELSALRVVLRIRKLDCWKDAVPGILMARTRRQKA